MATEYTLYKIRENVVFIHVPQEAFVINFNTTPISHYFTEDYLDRSIFCALCEARKQNKEGITLENIMIAIMGFFKPGDRDKLFAAIQAWLGTWCHKPPQNEDLVSVINSSDPGAVVTFFPTGLDKKEHTTGNLQKDDDLVVFKQSWGSQILPPNPLPYKICCF